jgi:hypothetical protein
MRIITATLFAGLITTFLTTPSWAAKERNQLRPDPVGDMQVFITDEKAPEITNGDITSVRLRTSKKRMFIHVTFVDLLDPAMNEGSTMSMLMFMNRANKRVLKGIASTNFGFASVTFAFKQKGKGKMKRKPCKVAHKIDYEANVLDLAFPKRCVGNVKKWAFASIVEQDDVTYYDYSRPRKK